MDSKMFLFVILMGFAVFSSDANTFPVGGNQGWVANPSEGYEQWANRSRFQVNDTLVFRYNNDTDSVLVLNNKQDYDSCNISSPVQKLEGGNSSFKFDKSGPFYFISGNQTNCQNGQKLRLIVISPRTKSTPPSPGAPSPSPGAPSPSSGGTPPSGGSTPSPSGSPTPGGSGGGGGSGSGGNTPDSQPPASSSSPALKSSMGFAFGFSMLVITMVSAF